MRNRKGFTLIELLVVVSIIALLVAILLPALGKARLQAKLVVCANNQRQCALGVTNYAADNDDKLPYHPTHCRTSSGERYSFPDYINYYVGQRDYFGGNGSMYYFLGKYLPDINVYMCPAGAVSTARYQDLYQYPQDGEHTNGSYCYYWDYKIVNSNVTYFEGPTTIARKRNESKLLMGDLFAFWAPNSTYTMWWLAHKTSGATAADLVDPVYSNNTDMLWWVREAKYSEPPRGTGFNSVYVDCHVERYDCGEYLPSYNGSWYFLPPDWNY